MQQQSEIEFANDFGDLRRLNETLQEKLDKESYPKVSAKNEKLQKLIGHLSFLITEKLEMDRSIRGKEQKLKASYIERGEKNNKPQISDDLEPLSANENELLALQVGRDKSLGLIKVLLAAMKSSRIQSEDNFKKLKYSADLMFHIMYKAEDAFTKRAT